MSTYTDASLIVTPNAKKAGKLYSLKGADLDVVRATTATYVGSDGLIKTALANEPRFDYSNGSCPIILVEPQRTNLLLRSEEFDDSYWTKINSTIVANSIISPDGALTTDKIIENAGSGIKYFIRNGINPVNTYTLSAYVKPNGRNFVLLSLYDGVTDRGAYFDVLNGTIGTIIGGATASIESVGNGFYRCKITATPVNTFSASFQIALSDSVRNYIGNGVSGLYIWAAQLEQGSNATSYIPTTTTTVTRNADVISKTGLTGITTITETFEDDTTNVISGSPTSYTMSQGRIKNVIGL